MEELRKLIQQVDDDYLIGLSNKGIVKRAYKDLEQESPQVTWQETGAQVKLREETCIIRAPLGESSCSCPSRSVCRHIVTAILWLKREREGATGEVQAKDIAPEPASAPEEGVPAAGDASPPEEGVPAAGGDGTEPAPKGDAKAVQEGDGNDGVGGEENRIPECANRGEQSDQSHLLNEALQIPVERLKRSCGNNRFRQFLARVQAGELPPMRESSIVTVELPWEQATVKLLEPLEYSTCSCHSKQLCAHKAQAILAYQLSKGKVRLQELSALQESEQSWDVEQVRQAGRSVREAIDHQMDTGLSRQSPEVVASLERLAVISHRAGLADLESGLRDAAGEYNQYFSRSAAFRSERLFRKLLTLRRKARMLEKAERQEEIARFAGTFRDTYQPVGKLHLLGVGSRSFSSKSGYEGETYYFLETRQKAWYTWTDARPVFYEGTRRRSAAAQERAAAPWGLACSREKLLGLEFELQGAKVAAGGRLSASQDTKSEVIGAGELRGDDVAQMICWDYEELLQEGFPSGQQRPALIGAVRWAEASFDQVQQRFLWGLFDRGGRQLLISLQYTDKDKATINLLERLAQRLKDNGGRPVIFFGNLYLDQGKLCLYPIECFRQDAGELLEMKEKMKEQWEEGCQRCESPRHGSTKSGEDPLSQESPRTAAQKGAPPEVSGQVLTSLEQYVEETEHSLCDLFVSGLSSMPRETAEAIRELSREGERLGLHGAGRELGIIGELLSQRSHQMSFDPEPVYAAMEQLNRYLSACREKLSLDRAFQSMQATNTNT